MEDEQGKPFVGPAGQLLWRQLARVGITSREVMAANAVSCYPQRTPTESERHACKGNLYDQVRRCHPSYILALGRTVNRSLGNLKPMSEIRGEWYGLHWFVTIEGWDDRVPVFPTFHPAAVLRNKALLRAWKGDLQAFAAVALA